MDAWEPYAVREHCRDAVAHWAKLEGKSDATAADLARRYDAEYATTDWIGALTLLGQLAVLAADAWLQITRR